MKKFIVLITFCFITFQLFSQSEERIVYGTVTANNHPLKSVSVLVKGTTTGVLTNKKGKYSISTKINDTIVFSHIGMQLVEIRVKSDMQVLDIELQPRTEKLDEVVVKKRRAKTQKELLEEYPRNKNLIKTLLGIVDKDRASHSIRIIDGKNLLPTGRDFLSSLQFLYPQMKVDRTPGPVNNIDPPRVYLQSLDVVNTALFDVDGVLYKQTPTFVDVHDIDRISILVRNGAISRYGSDGVGGVIIINTKSTNRMEDMGVKRTYDNSDLRDSISKVLKQKDEAIANYPIYIKDYLSITLEAKAFEIFQQQRLQYADSVYYFIDVLDYFKSIWDNPKTSQQILSFVNQDLLSNISDLKALAYKYEELGDYENALNCYLKIRKLKPADAQSHRNVANSYAQIGNFKKAFKTYARYKVAIDKIENRSFGVNESEKIIDTEMNNIVNVNSKDFSLKKSHSKKKSIAARLVFEWNNDQAEFNVQFVNPKQKYNSWRANKGKKSSKQFFLDDAIKGKWQVKISLKGNEPENPTYIKITTYFNYGKPSQSSYISVHQLEQNLSDLAILEIDTKQKQTLKQGVLQ